MPHFRIVAFNVRQFRDMFQRFPHLILGHSKSFISHFITTASLASAPTVMLTLPPGELWCFPVSSVEMVDCDIPAALAKALEGRPTRSLNLKIDCPMLTMASSSFFLASLSMMMRFESWAWPPSSLKGRPHSG